MIFTSDGSCKTVIEAQIILVVIVVALCKESAQRMIIQIELHRNPVIHVGSVRSRSGSGGDTNAGTAGSSGCVRRTQVVGGLEESAETLFLHVVVVVIV
jgi:hypothetical protein